MSGFIDGGSGTGGGGGGSGGPPSGSAGGDLSGTYPNPNVESTKALKSSSTIISISTATAPTSGQVLTATSGTAANWQTPSSSSITLAGDATGNSGSNTVVKINGATVPVSGSLTTGNILQVSGSNSLSYSAINLAGGSNFVSGILPIANQAFQTLTGDASGTTATIQVDQARGLKSATTTISVSTATAPNSGQVLTASSSTAASWITPTTPTGSASGDLSGTYPNPTVAKINSATVPAAGALTTGNGLYVSGVSSLSYSALNLAGGSNFITGVLPTANQAAQSLSGDLSGTTASATVAKINASSVPSGGALTTGNILQVSGISTLSYGPLNLSGGSNFITGVIPSGNQAAQTMSGDVSGTTASSTVAKINAATVPAAGSLTTGNILQVSGASALSYGALNLAGGANFVSGILPTVNQAAQTVGGDLLGTTATATVSKINGSTVPAGGALTTGNTLQVSGAGALSYSALNLAGGANFVSGLLPTANQSAQTMTGDVTGTTAANTVAKVNGTSYTAGGALTTGTIPRVTGASAVAYGALDLTNASAVSGALPTANQVAQTLGGDASGTTAAVQVNIARGLKSATTTVAVSAATAPTVGQVLTASNGTTASWVNPVSGVAGAVQFSGTTAQNSKDAQFHWDNTNNRLGIGTNTPSTTLNVSGATTLSGNLTQSVGTFSLTGNAASSLTTSSGNLNITSQGVLALTGTSGITVTAPVTVENYTGNCSLNASGIFLTDTGGQIFIQSDTELDISGSGTVTFSDSGSGASISIVNSGQININTSNDILLNSTAGNCNIIGNFVNLEPIDAVFIMQSISAPSSNPNNGGYLYVQNGALKYQSPNGTITTVAPL